MNIVYDRFPGGRTKALTLSYDDGRIHDRRMIEILNSYGLKGTFHLNSGKLGNVDYIEESEVKELYAGHEVAAHTVTHPHLPNIPKEMRVRELMNDRQVLERLVGYPVKGMSYPYGTVTNEVADLMPMLGFDYSRTTVSSSKFELPQQWHQWSPTCHHRDDLLTRTQTFLDLKHTKKPLLFYVWG
ncbi:MAG: polysaccharide deacetylase, partial [Paenibacillus sp.]|nr:polysaccharide deacetylase [Paenibacillus sp.]